jgi:ATP-dependent helicase/nuclease subunit A
MSLLTIYKASAGSGKTFTLTREYLRLLMDDPFRYRNILAVTFTNKAAAEMKSRILSELINLSQKKDSKYLSLLQKDMSLTEIQIRERATSALFHILHDYSHFDIETIDKFFQRIVRSFAREAGLQSNFQIEIDPGLLLNEAIDRLLDSLGDNKPLLNWMSGYVQEQIEQGSSWNVRKSMAQLGQYLFQETYAEHASEAIPKYSDKTFMSDYRTKLLSIGKKYEQDCLKLGIAFINCIESNGLQIADFSYGKTGIAGIFKKMAGGEIPEFTGTRFIKAADGAENWYKKGSPLKNQIESLWISQLQNFYHQAINLSNQKQQYSTATLILENFGSLALLTDIAKSMSEINHERNQFLLSDTSQLLRAVIAGNETPFIYEKTGSRYRHYMLDEFQDTSRMQWDNFQPLINNSLAQGDSCLVVGDVKQSIYRWRNGDWRLLSHRLAREFASWVQESTLDTNRRSAQEIVTFNNSFFSHAWKLLFAVLQDKNIDEDFARMLPEAYLQPSQQISGKTDKGYVEVCCLEAEKASDFKEKATKQAIQWYEQLIDLGVPACDIAFIVRTNGEGQALASAMLECKRNKKTSYTYDVISGEAFQLSSSPAVSFIIALLQTLLNPDNEVNNTFLRSEYYNYLQSGQNEEPYLSQDTVQNDKILPGLDNEIITSLRVVPLYECCEQIVQRFGLGKMDGQTPFLDAFFDILADYLRGNPADIELFIQWWTEKGAGKCLPAPENLDAATIITIHKSKGLEFSSVIMPYCSWELVKSGEQGLLWCKPDKEPFNELSLVPVKNGKKLAGTFFSKEYEEEYTLNYLDNLNLLYVAFTRACRHLFLAAWQKNENGVKNKTQLPTLRTASDLLINGLETGKIDNSEYPLIVLNEYWDNTHALWHTGTLSAPDIKARISTVPVVSVWRGMPASNRLRLKYAHTEFSPEEVSDILQLPQRDKGKLLHRLFAGLRTPVDLPNVLAEMLNEGIISQKESEILANEVYKALSEPKANEWFSSAVKVLPETSIILPGGEQRRPDRVMFFDNRTVVVDFKFGLTEKDDYFFQVSQYVELLQKMGNTAVEGWLWYVTLGRTVRVA